MRNNTRLISCYLMAMLLVNFYGNLMLTTQSVVRQKEPRKLMFILKIIRNILTTFIKLILGVYLIFYGIVSILFGIFFLWLCIIPHTGTCEMVKFIEDGFGMIGMGFSEIFDVKRILWDDAWVDDQRILSHGRRNLGNDPRALTQSPKSKEAAKVDLEEFKEMTHIDVIQSNAKDAFDSGREFVKNLKQVFQNLVEIRTKESCRVLTNPADPQCATLFNQVKTLSKETTVARVEQYRRKIRRIVICSINMVTTKFDLENNPEKFPPEKKKELEELMKASKSTDPKVQEKSKEQFKKIMADLKGGKENKNKMMEDFIMAMIHNGMSFHDAKSTYGTEMISAGFTAFAEVKMKKIQADPVAKKALADNGLTGVSMEEFEKGAKQVKSIQLPDNSTDLLNKSNNTVETEDDLKE